MIDQGVSRVQVGEHSIAYRRAGRGPALVLLHGFLCDSRVWRTQLAGLATDFAIVAWDAPGAGLSSDPPDAFTTDDWARCLARFLDAIGVTRAHVLGLSWGGILAQELYRVDPARIDRLILAGTYAGWRGSLPPEACVQRLARCEHDSLLPPAEFAPLWVPEMFTPAASNDLLAEMSTVFSGFHPHGFRLMAKSCADTDTTDLLPAIEAPTLLLWGDGDRRSPVTIAQQLHGMIPGAELTVIPEAGHVSNMERPEAFNAAVRRFLAS
jgi:pimeloyl-ACP methyl ester carboxylesterase